ncbi:MAG: GNAT family N-acetyltransferase [Candidatus Bathyarchaeota archaeon]|nr:GNAT family N-acetyltransferase [Candidatus Bathyarchaeota archaeon]
MPDGFSIEQVSYQRLSNEADVSRFNCSQNDLSGVNEFLHKEADRYQQEKMGTTYLFYYNNQIIAYVTVSMTCIDSRDAPDRDILDWFEKKKPPAMLVGQLGVDNKWRGRGIGSFLCDWCYGLAAEFSEEIGCRYVTLHTEKELISFYERNGFNTMKPNKKSPVMVRKIVDIR